MYLIDQAQDAAVRQMIGLYKSDQVRRTGRKEVAVSNGPIIPCSEHPYYIQFVRNLPSHLLSGRPEVRRKETSIACGVQDTRAAKTVVTA